MRYFVVDNDERGRVEAYQSATSRVILENVAEKWVRYDGGTR